MIQQVAAVFLLALSCACVAAQPRSEQRAKVWRDYFREETVQADRWGAACFGEPTAKCAEIRRYLLESHDILVTQTSKMCALFPGQRPKTVLPFTGEPDGDSTEGGVSKGWSWSWGNIAGGSVVTVYWTLQADGSWLFNKCRLCEVKSGAGGCRTLPFE